ncbi:MAG: hypothetical protein WA001_02355 [Patescibacteria group bacterium]
MTVKIVNAAKIRNTIDTDFSGVGTHADFPYIPLGELWIDRFLKNEKPLFLALVKLERAMRGKPFRLIRAQAKKTLTTKAGIKIVSTKTLKKGMLRICHVDGAIIRKNLDPYFLLGGHDLVYPYIPKREIWIDTRSDPQEWKYTMVHELEERERMSKGMLYDDAHDLAVAIERAARRKDGVADFIRG